MLHLFFIILFVCHDITHIMNIMILIFKIVQTLFVMIRKFWTEIVELKVSQTSIFIFSTDNNMNLSSVLKSEKFSDLFIFNDNWKKLHLFITKLHLKLERNVNQFSTDINKISYRISQLEKNIIITINFFYWNDILINLNILIKFLKIIYDDVSQKYMTLIRLKTCQQMNCKFISFYFKFLTLMNELNWNENMKIITLWRTIFNEVQSQLIDRDMLSTLTEFIVLCQWIDEDFYLNQASWYQQSNAQWNFWSVISAFLNSLIFTHDLMNIDVIHTQYAFIESDEQKTHLTKNECFYYN